MYAVDPNLSTGDINKTEGWYCQGKSCETPSVRWVSTASLHWPAEFWCSTWAAARMCTLHTPILWEEDADCIMLPSSASNGQTQGVLPPWLHMPPVPGRPCVKFTHTHGFVDPQASPTHLHTPTFNTPILFAMHTKVTLHARGVTIPFLHRRRSNTTYSVVKTHPRVPLRFAHFHINKFFFSKIRSVDLHLRPTYILLKGKRRRCKSLRNRRKPHAGMMDNTRTDMWHDIHETSANSGISTAEQQIRVALSTPPYVRTANEGVKIYV